MNAVASTKLFSYSLLAAAGMAAAIIVGSPDLALLALPFAGIVVVGVASRRPTAAVTLLAVPERALAGEEIQIKLQVTSSTAMDATVTVATQPTLSATVPLVSEEVQLRENSAAPLSLHVRATRWGRYNDLHVDLYASDRLGLFRYRLHERFPIALRVYPDSEAINRQLVPRHTQALTGDFVSAQKGDGLEFADIREYVEGDRIRRVNWGVSARKGKLHVNQYRPERNADLVIFLDTFNQLAEASGNSLTRTVAAATTIAQLHLKRHDRVGLVCFGGLLRWLTPASSPHQTYRITDALLETTQYDAPGAPLVEMLPRQMLPTRAKILAISPLIDERATDALLSLCRRGLDVAILELPVPLPAHDQDELSKLTARLWTLRRRSTTTLLQSAGAAIVAWPEELPLSAAIEQVNEWQQVPRRSLA